MPVRIWMYPCSGGWECVSKKVCVCECVIPSSTHYSRTYPRVAFTSDLCSAAGTITERPDSSANVHHIHSVSPLLPPFLPLLFLHIRLTGGANLKRKRRKTTVNLTCRLIRWSFIFSWLQPSSFFLAFLSMNHSCSYVFSFLFLTLYLMHFLCTLNHRLSKVSAKQSRANKIKRGRWSERTWDGKRGNKDRVRREAWLGAVTGQLPVPLPAFFSPSSPPPPPLSIHPQVTELPSGRGGGMKRLRENYTESFSLTRQGKLKVGNFKQLLKRRGRVGEKGWTREGQREKKTEKAIWDLRSW